jgi:hypothetical protein
MHAENTPGVTPCHRATVVQAKKKNPFAKITKGSVYS